jgi:uncharacterized protein YecT (DUF1311 family)
VLVLLAGVVMCTPAASQTQAEMKAAASQSYQEADQELNAVYKQILTLYKTDTTFIANLKESQRIWIRFRDAELAMLYPDRETGSDNSDFLTNFNLMKIKLL